MAFMMMPSRLSWTLASVPPSVEDTYAAEVRSELQQWFLSPLAYPTHTIMHYDELYKKFDAVGLYSRKSNLHMRNSSCVHFVLQGMLEKVQAGALVLAIGFNAWHDYGAELRAQVEFIKKLNSSCNSDLMKEEHEVGRIDKFGRNFLEMERTWFESHVL